MVLRAELDLPALGNQSDHKVDGMPNFIPNPGVGPMPNPGAGEVALNWPLRPPQARASREKFPPSVRHVERAMPPLRRSPTTTTMRSVTPGQDTPRSGAFKNGFPGHRQHRDGRCQGQRRAHRDRGADLLDGEQQQSRGQLRRPARRLRGTTRAQPVRTGAPRRTNFSGPARTMTERKATKTVSGTTYSTALGTDEGAMQKPRARHR